MEHNLNVTDCQLQTLLAAVARHDLLLHRDALLAQETHSGGIAAIMVELTRVAEVRRLLEAARDAANGGSDGS